MLADQERGIQDLRYPTMDRPELPRDVLRAGVGNSGAFVNPTPPQGFGSAIYSDTAGGATGGGFTVAAPVQALGPDGRPIHTPFGRTEEEQAKIAKRVGQYQSAIDLMRSLRGIPSERDRLTSRAGQRISLNQGIGGFANQVADRNFARDQLKALDAREASAAESANEAARLGFDIQQAGITNALEQEKVNQGRFKLQNYTKDYDPLGRAIQGVNLLDTRSGAVTDPTTGIQPRLTPQEARQQAEREADDAMGGFMSALFTSEKDVFGGKTKDEWIEARIQKLTGQGGPAAAGGTLTARNPKTGEVVMWNGSEWQPVTG